MTTAIMRGGGLVEYFTRPFTLAKAMHDAVDRATKATASIPWEDHGECILLDDWTLFEVPQPWPDKVTDKQDYYVAWGPKGAIMDIGNLPGRGKITVLDGAIRVRTHGANRVIKAFDRRATPDGGQDSLLVDPARRHSIEAIEYTRLLLTFRPPLKVVGAKRPERPEYASH